eukprot:m.132876 g.132876  ORF g.132876 m.132876 type:complete len:371 (+) comp29637_c0_seq3:146-1258(+)
MAKANIDLSVLSFHQITCIVKGGFCLGLPVEKEISKLYGGYSGSNYSVGLCGNPNLERVCIKVCNGYLRSEIEDQAKIMHYLKVNGFRNACFAYPLPNTDDKQFAIIDNVPAPTLCLSFCSGVAADAVLSPTHHQACSQDKVMFSAGKQLARLHGVVVTENAGLRTYENGGVCNVIDHINDTSLKKMATSEFTNAHPYFEFYKQRLCELKTAMEASVDLPWGVLHGDPFLDNCLITQTTDVEATWIDFEDTAVGPLLFDVACCVIGSCFKPSPDNTFDLSRLQALMRGYVSARRLTLKETELLVPFLRLTLLCNCSWRFTNFHIDHREISECRDSYLELQHRIVALLQPDLISQITSVVGRVNLEAPPKE